MAKTKNTGLGRGLDSIFLDNAVEETSGGVTVLRLSEIEPNPDQPRRDFDPESLSSLAESIAAHGLIQPLVVRHAKSEGYYQIIAGERRWRASKMAGLVEVPVIVMEADDGKAAQLALIENIQREDLNPIDEAAAMEALMEGQEMTQEALSRAIGRSRSAIANAVRLLDLPPITLEMVRKGELSAGHARALLALDMATEIDRIAGIAVEKGLTVRQVEAMVRDYLTKQKHKGKESAPNGDGRLEIDYTSLLAGRMSSRMGREVRIKNTGKHKHIEIAFTTEDDLDAMVKLLCGDNIWDEE